MTADAGTHVEPHPDRTALLRIDAMVGGLVWWACHLGATYWLIPRMCSIGSAWPVHLVTVLLVGLVVRAGWSATRLVRAGRADLQAGASDARRDVFLGWNGLALSIFFGAVIVAQWSPVLWLDPCW